MPLPIEDRRAPSLIADAERANAPQAATIGSAAVANADVATAAEPVTKMATDKTVVASADPAAIVELALPDPSPVLPPETPPVQVATANPSDLLPDEVKEAPVSTIEIVDECLVVDICIDRYLWALYQRTPKQDTMKVQERRVTIQVTVKKKRKKIPSARSSPGPLPSSSLRTSRGKIRTRRKKSACR